MITFKQGDTRHAIKATLKDVAGNAIDLTGATVRFIMATKHRGILVDKAAILQDGQVLIDREVTQQNGQVWMVFEDGETDQAGTMNAEFRVLYPDGRTETFPHDGYLQITILKTKGAY